MIAPSDLVLDAYDDSFAAVPRLLGGRALPELIKTAAALTPDHLNALPDHAFAAVFTDGSARCLRKYACHDSPHTVLSVMYFLDAASRIPDRTRTKIASNLCWACRQFDLEIPEPLQKLAGQDHTRKTLIKGDGVPVRVPVNVDARRKEMTKTAELSGTRIMPLSAPRAAVQEKKKGKIEQDGEKTAMDPYVSWAGSLPERTRPEPVYEHYALPDHRLPLDTFEQVKVAAEFLEREQAQIHPRTKHGMALAIMKQAEDFGVGVGDVVRQYGSDGLNPEEYLSAGVETRQRIWAGTKTGAPTPDLYAKLMEKCAELAPEAFAETLCQLDESLGMDRYWNRHFPDPWATVFCKYGAEEWSWTDGRGMTLDREGLVRTAADQEQVKAKLGEDLAAGLASDPIGIFESLPLDTQRVIAALSRK